MSVQVRRRREAASFLSTYVGAQGELLVDTTNNRIQVHDGSTPGGWPAAGIGDLAGRNTLINGNFAINQRGFTSGASLAAGAYAHDRWKAGSGGCTYTFTQAVPDTTVTITAGTLIQAIEGSNVTAPGCWLSWLGTAQARIWQGSAAGAYASSPVLVTGLALGAVTSVEFSTGTLGVVQLEVALPNAGPTRFERRLNELILCQRYYQLSNATVANLFQSGTINAAFPFTTPMRAVPTIAVANGSNAVDRPGVAFYNVTGISLVFGPGSQSALVQLATNGTSLGLCEIFPGTLSFSAEI